MDLQFGSVTTKTSRSSLWWSSSSTRTSSSSSRRRASSSSSSSSSPLKKTPICSRKDSQPPQNGDNNNNNNNKGDDRFSTDWDKAWSSFKKKGKKTLFSQFNPNKYVSWNPRRSEYPMSEEVDPIKKAERTNLMLWTSPKFTLAGAIVVVSLLLIYTLSAPVK